jgi:hypothetical protein
LKKALLLGLALCLVLSAAGCSVFRQPDSAIPRDQAGQDANSFPTPKTDTDTGSENPLPNDNNTEQGRVIISENPVRTDAGRLLEDLNKEIDELLLVLESMDSMSAEDLNY